MLLQEYLPIKIKGDCRLDNGAVVGSLSARETEFI
jgi:hypothetical protein